MTTGWQRWTCLAWLCLIPFPGDAVTPMVAASLHTVAVKDDGAVLAWGSNSLGQLGIGNVLQSNTPLQVRGLAQIRSIAAGLGHVLALKQDGTVWAWGKNDNGELGDGSYSPRSAPTLVANETVDGPLDLAPAVANNIPVDKIPPFFLAATKTGGLSATTLYVDFKGGTGRGSFASSGHFAAGYNLYVAASVPLSQPGGAPLWWQLDGNRNWGALSAPMAAYLSGVALDSQTTRVRADILENVNLSQLIGTVIYVGYGIDTDEMLRAGRYRDIFTVTLPQQ